MARDWALPEAHLSCVRGPGQDGTRLRSRVRIFTQEKKLVLQPGPVELTLISPNIILLLGGNGTLLVFELEF